MPGRRRKIDVPSRSMRTRIFLLFVLAVTSSACTPVASPRPQLLVVLDTDVPVSEFADRLRIELFDPSGTVQGQARDVVLESRDDLPVTFGFRAPDDAGVGAARLRVRAYRSGDAVFDANGAEPEPLSTIDRVMNLRADASDTRQVRVVLHGDCIGVPADVVGGTSCITAGAAVSAPSPEPITAPLGAPLSTVEGTWAAAQRIDCVGAPRAESGILDEEVCARGGAFYFGLQQGEIPAMCPATEECDRQPPRLAVVSPFFIDRYEVSIGRFQAAMRDPSRPFVPPFLPVSDGATLVQGLPFSSECLWPGVGPFDPRPLNCVAVATARAFCAWAGGDLPTEAQWEYAASRAFAERKQPFPWGSATPTCGGTVFGVSGIGFECLDSGASGNLLPVNAPFPDVDAACSDAGCALDVTPGPDGGGGGIVGMAGNVGELVRDAPAAAADPCWGARVDPACASDSGANVNFRGAAWAVSGEFLYTGVRTARSSSIAPGGITPPANDAGIEDLAQAVGGVGFRCVRPGK